MEKTTRLGYALRTEDPKMEISATLGPGRTLTLNGKDTQANWSQTPIGLLVTAETEVVPDSHVMTASVLLPNISPHAGRSVPISTFVIRATQRFTIAGPPPGQTISYEVVPAIGNGWNTSDDNIKDALSENSVIQEKGAIGSYQLVFKSGAITVLEGVTMELFKDFNLPWQHIFKRDGELVSFTATPAQGSNRIDDVLDAIIRLK